MIHSSHKAGGPAMIALIVAVLMSGLTVAVPTPTRSAQDPTPTVQLSEVTAVAGESIRVSGQHYPGDTSGEVSWDVDGSILGLFTTRRGGSFEVDILVPAGPVGRGQIRVVVGQVSAAAPFEIVSAPTPTLERPTETLPAPATETEVPPTDTAVVPPATSTDPTHPAETPVPTSTEATSSSPTNLPDVSTPPTGTSTPASPDGGDDGERLVFGASADASVNLGEPDENYGREPFLKVDGEPDPTIWSYLRFDVSGARGQVLSATLRLYVTAASEDGPLVASASSEWAENELTWSSRPPLTSAATDDLAKVREHEWVELDVTSLVTGDGVYTVVLVPTSKDGADFVARERAEYAPQLTLVVSPDSSLPTSTPLTPAAVETPNASRGADGDVGPVTSSASLRPTCAVTPTSANVGDRLSLTCRRFGPREQVTVTWDGVQLTSFTTDRNGAGSVRLLVPRSPSGLHTIRMRGEQSGGTNTKRVTVVPSVGLMPNKAAAGSTVRVVLRGFGPGESIRLRLRTAPRSSRTVKTGILASRTGSASATFVVPAGHEGAYLIEAVGTQGFAATRFTRIAPAPTPTATRTSVATTTPAPTASGTATATLTTFATSSVTSTRSPFSTPTSTTAPTRTSMPTGTLTPTPTPQLSATATATVTPRVEFGPPIRAAFYYPWFPEAWRQRGMSPYTNYTPTNGYYNGSDQAVVSQQIEAMQYGNIDAGIVSWWGQGHATDGRFPLLLSAASGTGFKWAAYYELESQGDPSVTQLRADLTYLRDRYASDPSYLRVDGRFVVFVYSSGSDSCAMVDRWEQANTVDAFVVLKVHTGYRTCRSQPDHWHQYAPANPADQIAGMSYSISPGFWLAGQGPRLERDLARWRRNVQEMVASGAPLQLVISFNEWGEGTSIESAQEWESASGYGHYLDVLHSNGSEPIGSPTPSPTPEAGGDPVLLAAGDIAGCNSTGDEATAALLDKMDGTVAALGDIAYDSGSAAEFQNCFDPSWGRHRDRIRPAIGNHEYLTQNAAPYFSYFGAAAGDPTKGYYSYDLGEWHIIVLNSQCSKIKCDPLSAQYAWLQADLAAHPTSCSLAYFHHPAFSSGEHGNSAGVVPLWKLLYAGGTEIVLVGHDHIYERFAPMDGSGSYDPAYGIREFVVGTGGKSHTTFPNILSTSEVREANTYGLLKLTLHDESYDWRFVPVAGKTFSDAGVGRCHGRPPPAASPSTDLAGGAGLTGRLTIARLSTRSSGTADVRDIVRWTRRTGRWERISSRSGASRRTTRIPNRRAASRSRDRALMAAVGHRTASGIEAI